MSTCSMVIQGQVPPVSELRSMLAKEKNDSAKALILSHLVENADQDEWPKFNDELGKLCEKKLLENGLRRSLVDHFKRLQGTYKYNLATFLYMKGSYSEAKALLEECRQLFVSLNKKSDIGHVYRSLSLIYQTNGDIKKAIALLIDALKISEETNDEEAQANCLNSLGLLFDSQKEYDKAIESFNKCFTISNNIGLKQGAYYSLINTAFTYQNKKDVPNAFKYSLQSLKMSEEMNDEYAHAYALSNMGTIYSSFGDPETHSSKEASLIEGKKKGLRYFRECLALREKTGDKNGITQSILLIGKSLAELKNYQEAEVYYLKGLKLGQELGTPKNISSASTGLYLLYKTKGRYDLALKHFEVTVAMRDSINNESTRKAAIRSQLKYEYEKQAAADSVSHAKMSEIKNAEIAKQTAEIKAKRNQQYALFGGLGLVMVFAGFMYNRFKVTQKQKGIIESQKEIVEEQKKLVEEKQKEIVDSIHYAKRIQMAQVPSEKRVQSMLVKLKK